MTLPMRAPLAFAITLASAGCQPECGSPTQLQGPVWQMFGNVITWQAGPTGVPPGATPVNGYTDWSFVWPDPFSPAIGVTIDDQSYDANAVWSTTECGNFSLTFAGVFTSRTGSVHTFTAAGNVLSFGTQLEAALAWSETWQYDGEVGTLQASDASASGLQYPP